MPNDWTPEMPLRKDFTSAELRARFDVLMDRLDEFYDHEAWDVQVVAWFIAHEALAATRADSLMALSVLDDVVTRLRENVSRSISPALAAAPIVAASRPEEP